MKIIIKDSYADLSRAAADIVKDQIRQKPNSVLGLATGSTPEGMYEELVKDYEQGKISFRNVTTINLDEYVGLDPHHEKSYRYYMNSLLFDKVDINKDKTHVPNGMAEDLDNECRNYEWIIKELGGQDLQILGVGKNGHIGFNEPANKLEKYTHIADLAESTINANSRFFKSIIDVPTRAISMGMGSIFRAKKIVILASGVSKSKIMSTLQDTHITTMIPLSFLKLHPDLTVIMDKDAARYFNL